MNIENVISLSSGKDSTAVAILAVAMETPNTRYVFADTGHEHPETYRYIEYLADALNIQIDTVKADFSEEIARKRQKLINGRLKGWTDAATQRALEILQPTGIPFLDLCLWKGRFPSSKARFCTDELKRNPIFEQVFFPILEAGKVVWSWQGVRRDESLARRYAPEFDEVGGGLFNYRPIARWTVESVFEAHRFMGIEPNPLYKQGMGRVGCMPCVNCNKSELLQIGKRFPDEIDRVREWEHLVSQACRLSSTTFFTATDDPTVSTDDDIHYTTHGIDRRIEWSQTTRGGRIMDLIAASSDPTSCKSAYGLCDGG